MNPVLIIRHIACEGPAYLADFLKSHDIPFKLVRTDEGEQVPSSVDDIAGLVFMGGPMSVNDPLPWINDELDLIRKAHERRLPVLGHCLGGQLIGKALGGEVTHNPVTEIGWFTVEPFAVPAAPDWLRDLDYKTELFHWHGETFTLPRQAIPLFRNQHCLNQGFMLDHTFALQCHVEMRKEDVSEWLTHYKNDIPPPGSSVQTPAEMVRNLDRRIRLLHEFADGIYTQWLNGFKS